MKNSIFDRIKITKSGKIIRRAPGLSHSRANKSSRELQRKKRERGLELSKKAIGKYL